MLPSVRPFKSGGICFTLALALMFSAGTLGLGPDTIRDGYWDADFIRDRGGYLGESVFYVCHTLIGSIGTHIFALFLFLAGTLLLTGASLAGILKATGGTAARSPSRRGRCAPRGRGPAAPEAEVKADAHAQAARAGPGRGGDADDMVVKATHVEAPSLDGPSATRTCSARTPRTRRRRRARGRRRPSRRRPTPRRRVVPPIDPFADAEPDPEPTPEEAPRTPRSTTPSWRPTSCPT